MRSNEYQEIREQIVQAAGLVFAQYGYRKTTIEDIASAVHKTKSALYHYFTGKDDIFRAVVEQEASQLMRSLYEAVEMERSPVMKFRTLFRFLCEKIEDMTNYYRFVKDEWYDILDFTNEMRLKHWKFIEGLIVSILVEGNAAGLFAVDDPPKKANAIQVALFGFLTPWSGLKWEEVAECIEPIIELLLCGLMKRQDTAQG